jgi:hypothetical protein
MALHARRQIVIAAKAALAGLPSIAGGVFEGLAGPKSVDATPYLLVYARPEQSAPHTMKGAARSLARELTLAVEGVTAETGTETGDALLDAIALEVESALAGNPTLGGVCRDLYLVRTDPNARAEGEHRTGRIRLEFTVLYFTAANAPDRAL